MAELNGDGESHAHIELAEAGPGHVTATISGELDLHSVDRLNGTVDELLTRPLSGIAFDLSEVEFMDSSGLALLLRLTNQFGPAPVKGAKPIIRRVIEVSGLAGVLQLEGGPS